MSPRFPGQPQEICPPKAPGKSGPTVPEAAFRYLSGPGQGGINDLQLKSLPLDLQWYEDMCQGQHGCRISRCLCDNVWRVPGKAKTWRRCRAISTHGIPNS